MHSGVNQTVNDFLSKSYAKGTVDRYYASADQYTKTTSNRENVNRVLSGVVIDIY